MEIKGEIVHFYPDFASGKNMIVISSDSNFFEAAEPFLKKIVRVTVKQWREKRSLDANAYFHVLVGKIADKLILSKAKAKNVLICKYGQPQLLPDENILVYKTNAPEEFMWEQESIHCIPVKYEETATFYKVYRGSHTYDTAEMSVLIDGTVEDAKELEIETATPDEIERMKQQWKV